MESAEFKLLKVFDAEAMDRTDVKPRLSYAVYGSIGGGGTRHTKATVRLFLNSLLVLKMSNGESA